MGKKTWIRLGLALTSFALAVPVADRVVRALDPYGIAYYDEVGRYLRDGIGPSPQHGLEGEGGRIFENLPEIRHEHRGFTFATDAHGLRRGERWDYEPGRADDLRILFLGDSVTLGWGVDDEDTWVRSLESRLRATDGRTVRCLNAGHLMFDTVQEASLLAAWGPVHRPDVVVVTFVFNDVHPTWGQYLALAEGRSEDSLAANEPSRVDRFVEGLAPNVGKVLRYRREAKLYASADKSTLAPYVHYPSGWPRCAGALDRIRATCEELGARLVVMDHTIQQAVPELVAWCATNDVPYVDTRWTDEEAAQDVRVSAVDAHANELGNRYIAEKAAAGLAEHGLLELVPRD